MKPATIEIPYNGEKFFIDIADGNMVNLNKLHELSGATQGRDPREWSRLPSTKKLIKTINGGLSLILKKIMNWRRDTGAMKRLFYFTSTNYGISDLSLKRLKISRFHQLNDPFELLAAELLDHRDRNALSKFKEEVGNDKGIICFSESWSNPLLWGHYAEKHSGMALGFDVSRDNLFQVNYTTDRAKIEFDENARKIVNGNQVMKRLLSTKFVDWKYEEEWRMLAELKPTSQEGENYFEEFSSDLVLCEVILGLKCDLSVSSVRKLLKDELTSVKVLRAKMDSSEFKIIEDPSAQP